MEKKFDIEINPEVAKGNYANLAIITHSSSEFIHAKRLLGALTENIRKYEGQFGEIKLPIGPIMMPPIKPDAEA